MLIARTVPYCRSPSCWSAGAADLLRTPWREHQVWGWVDDVEMQGGEVDHLAVTREGGVVAMTPAGAPTS